MQWSVFVNSIEDKGPGGIVVEAFNGSPEGPPFVRFNLPILETQRCNLGKRYILTVEEAE